MNEGRGENKWWLVVWSICHTHYNTLTQSSHSLSITTYTPGNEWVPPPLSLTERVRKSYLKIWMWEEWGHGEITPPWKTKQKQTAGGSWSRMQPCEEWRKGNLKHYSAIQQKLRPSRSRNNIYGTFAMEPITDILPEKVNDTGLCRCTKWGNEIWKWLKSCHVMWKGDNLRQYTGWRVSQWEGSISHGHCWPQGVDCKG